MYWIHVAALLLPILTVQAAPINSLDPSKDTPPCASTSATPVGTVKTYSAYACRGELQTFANVTTGLCTDAKNFTTAAGWRKGSAPEGHDCTFNFFAEPGCKGPFVSAGSGTDGSSTWMDCVRSFVDKKGDVVDQGRSFMYVCYARK